MDKHGRNVQGKSQPDEAMTTTSFFMSRKFQLTASAAAEPKINKLRDLRF